MPLSKVTEPTAQSSGQISVPLSNLIDWAPEQGGTGVISVSLAGGGIIFGVSASGTYSGQSIFPVPVGLAYMV